jgi:hypothetical protein
MKLLCICSECFYGSRCQFSTEGFSLSLDTILAYQIRLNVSFFCQRSVIKVSLSLTILVFCLGLINGLLSTITFHIKQLQQVGCGIYLFISSLISFISIIMILLKFIFLLLAQTNQILNRTYLYINCILIDFLLQISLNIINWLNACVGIERVVNVYQGVQFDKMKSIKCSIWIIILVILLTISSGLHDPFHCRLIDDEDQDDRRTLCTVAYSPMIKKFDFIMTIIHFFVPIIIVAARKRSSAQTQFTRREHLKKQFDEHKHLLISSIILILLALPRLVISFTSGCMKSVRDPWLFLAGYFVSFLPSISNFIIFVLPSKMYKKQLLDWIQSFHFI